MFKRSIMICMLVTGLATVSSYAQEKKDHPRRDPEELFKKLDTDSDGKISKDEADKAEHKMLKEHFSDIDTNADGYITKEELKAFKPKGGRQRKD